MSNITKKLKSIVSAFLIFVFLSSYFPLPATAQEGYGQCTSDNFQNYTSYSYLSSLDDKSLLNILNEAEAICNILSLTNGTIDSYFDRGYADYPSSSYMCGAAEEAKSKIFFGLFGEKIKKRDLAITFIRNVYTKAPSVISQLGCPDPASNSTLIANAKLNTKSINALKELCSYCETLNPTRIENLAKGIRRKIIASEWWVGTKEVVRNTAKDIADYANKLLNRVSAEDCINLSGWKIVKDLITLSFFQFLEDIIFIPLVGILRYVLKWIIQVWIWFLTPDNFGGYASFPPVIILWQYIRNLSYIGIIISFIIMAIATILRIKEYDWSQILWRIVAVALLVNFSLVICGMFVDISNFFTAYFVSNPPLYSSDNQPTATAGLEITIPHVITKIACHFPGNRGTVIYTAGLFLSLILAIIFIGQFVGILGYTIIRVVTLWVTLILSPLAAVAFILPGLRKGWESWRNYFTQALVSLPVIAFSLWLVIGMLNAFVDGLNAIGSKGAGELTIIPALAHAILILILAQAILAVAGALGIEQIQKGYQFATKLVWGALGFLAGSAYKGTARSVVKSQAWEQTAKRLEESGNRMLYRIGRTMSDTRARIIGEKIKSEREYLSNLDPVQTRNYIKRNVNNPDLVALGVNRLIDLGQLGVDDQPYIDIASKSPYFRPPPDSRKNNFVVFGRSSLVEDDKKLEYRNNAQKTLSQYQNYGIDPNAIQALGDENLVLFDIGSTLKASDIEQQNWDNIWEKYLNTLSKQQRDTFLFGLVLSQGTKLAIIDQAARSHRIDIGKAIVDATYNHLKKLEPTAKLKDAVDFLLEDKVTIGKKVFVGLGGKINTGFKNWIITSSGI